MADFRVGERVVAVENIGGFMREAVPKGTRGVVVQSSWGKLTVKFAVKGFLGSQKPVEIDVNPREIR